MIVETYYRTLQLLPSSAMVVIPKEIIEVFKSEVAQPKQIAFDYNLENGEIRLRVVKDEKNKAFAD